MRIGNHTFMNLQEAVGWLLENNALPFQSTANYIGNTEIAMSTLINPSPAKVRVGSLIFFADSKVSTVVGVTSNSFIVSDQYNDLVDDIVYVSNVALNASGHLIVTLSNGDTIDAGLVKQVAGFSINGSQHLIVSYNDGSTTDLGAIFAGNVNIAGNLTADSIIENMSGYVFDDSIKNPAITIVYGGVVKTGNKITFVVFGKVTPTSNVSSGSLLNVGAINIPSAVGSKLYPYTQSWITNVLSSYSAKIYNGVISGVNCDVFTLKASDSRIYMQFCPTDNEQLTANETYIFRIEQTFLLSDNLAS